jgi:hypothetical protein
MSEEMDIYIQLKKYLKTEGWTILAGQPPSGTDHLPVIEIKRTHGLAKGSRESFKPDLLALRNEQLMIFELKPTYSQSDYQKLSKVLEDPERLENLWREIAERRLKTKDSTLVAELRDSIRISCALAYAGTLKKVSKIWTFSRDESSGFKVIPPSDL